MKVKELFEYLKKMSDEELDTDIMFKHETPHKYKSYPIRSLFFLRVGLCKAFVLEYCTDSVLLGDIEMAKKWLQKANSEMKSKGTVGAFTAQAKKAAGVKKGGGIKDSFIAKELKSDNPTTRKRAQFAKNMKAIARGKQ